MYHSPRLFSLSLFYHRCSGFSSLHFTGCLAGPEKLLIRNAVNLLQSDQDADPDTVAAQFHLGDDFPADREAHDLELYRDLLLGQSGLLAQAMQVLPIEISCLIFSDMKTSLKSSLEPMDSV